MENEKKKKHFLLLIALTILVLLTIGYFFASQKSEPEYLSKIDKIMFDKKNKSPKYILTLPNKNEAKPVIEEKTITLSPQKTQDDTPLSPTDLLNSIPLISKLSPIENPKPLNIIDIDNSVSEKIGDLQLPKIAGNGNKPWMKYGKRENVQPNFYRVAVIFKNIGLDIGITEASITAMPSNVSLAFSPYTINATENIKKARMNGHETYVDLLLSSRDVLKSDNGPLSMSLTTSVEENMERLHKALSFDAPVGGMLINDGVADSDNVEQLTKLLTDLKERGVLIVDATVNDTIEGIKIAGLARKKADIRLENILDREEINRQLKYAEQLAKSNGQVLIVATPKPMIMNAVSEWINTFSPQLTYQQIKDSNAVIEKPFALVPVSNLVVE